ncbi:uncharacterized protein LOC135470577 [Liolophura sinensis]|uniref:uncharacterized protein LOC135470577 n=1 Tax=Liolophura sinensis TaxID=3198878 RepID=UPI0031584B9E
MYPLFELVRLISFGHDAGVSKVSIEGFAWREVGEANLLALVCSNGYVVLRYSVSGKRPVTRQLPWHDDKQIVSLCFDPTATWLLILTLQSELFIVPALSLLDPLARVNQLWRLDDITSLRIQTLPRGPSVVCWWHTLDDYQIAIVGTKESRLLFVDLRRQDVLTEMSVNGTVSGLELVQDDDQMSTHLLITLDNNEQWKLLLECQTCAANWKKIQEQDWTDLGYDHVDTAIVSVINQTDMNKHLFYPLRFYQFTSPVYLSPQYAKGRHFISAHDGRSCQYQILDSGMEQSPLFVYQVPLGADNLIFSDKIIFCTTNVGGKKLNIISNQRAETSMADQQVFNTDATFQQFTLRQDEKLLAVLKKSFPFYWHEKREEEEKARVSQSVTGSQDVTLDEGADSIRITTHTVLDGCILVSNSAVYECRPRVSPERLFLDFAIQQSGPSVAENLGIGLGLDVNSLFELVAEYKLAKQEYSQAIKLYQLSKCSHAKRVASFARHGCIPEVMTYLKQVLTNQKSDVNTGEKKLLADMALYCFIHQIQESGSTSAAPLRASFRDFLMGSFSYNEKTALELLAKHRLNDLLLELAKARGLILEALQLMADDGIFDIGTLSAGALVTRGFGSHLARVSEGAFLDCMPLEDMTELLSIRPQLAVQHMDKLEPVLPQLNQEQLLKLAQIFDPSKPMIRGYLIRGQRSRTRTTSISSLASYSGEFGDSLSQDSNVPDISRLIHFFLTVILILNEKRKKADGGKALTTILDESLLDTSKESDDSLPEERRLLALQPWPIGCGQNHAAIVRNGDVYTFGRSQSGRLGHGDLSPENVACPITRVESLHMLQIKVLSVACGGEHTVVLTQQGVYSWGSSRYGQVGVGTSNQTYSRPMLVEKLTDIQVVSVDCGQYHSLALTASGLVYSWGWGVHGQLGHGTAEDCLVPTKIFALSSKMVTRISAGYCHTVILTAEGEVWTFGCGLFGQLGIGSANKDSIPKRVRDIPGKVTLIATKYFHTLALLANNKLFTWGCHPMALRQTAHMIKRHRQGAVGHHQKGVVEKFMLPYLVDTSYVHSKITQLSCGSLHSALLTSDGEVYMWGRNIDGQLGTGTRQESQYPVMLTSINDRSISHLTCGGEFNIAMDTDFLIWVWGKNEAGQLGIGRSEGQNRPHPSRQSMKKNPSTMMYDIVQPTTLKGVPSVPIATSWQRAVRSISVESSDSESGLLWSVESYDERDPQVTLPQLDKMTDPPYSPKVLAIVLESLGERCNLQKLCRDCLDCEDWASAAEVQIYQQNYAQALGYHLRHLSDQREHLGSLEEFLNQSRKVLDYHVRQLKQCPLTDQLERMNWRVVLLEVMNFWEDNHLPVAHLEAWLLFHLDTFVQPLSLMLFRAEEQNHSNSIGIPKRIRGKMNTTFQLMVLSKFLTQIQTEESADEVSDVFGECLAQSGDSQQALPLKSGDKLIPYDRLWHEVLQNVRKDWDMHNYIYLTARDIDILQLQVGKQKSQSASQNSHQDSSDTVKDGDVVVFSCGHNYANSFFQKEIVPELNRDIGIGPLALPKTATLLTQYYNRRDFIPMACPKCVLTTVQAIK